MNGKILQFAACIALSMPQFILGSSFVWPSYTLVLLKSPKSPLEDKLSLLQEALMGSLSVLSAIFLSPFGGMILDNLGRLRSALLMMFMSGIFWCIVIYAKTVFMLLVGRFIFGLCAALGMQVGWAFTAEVSEDSIRGLMTSLPTVTFGLATLISMILGWMCDYYQVAYANLAIISISFIAICLLPETPVYLMYIGRGKDALKSLAFYRGCSVNDKKLVAEIETIKRLQEEKQSFSLVPTQESEVLPEKPDIKINDAEGTQRKLSGWRYLVSTRPALRAFLICNALLALSVLSGMIALQVYGGILFAKAAPSFSSDFCSALLCFMILVSSIFSAPLTDILGRKILLEVAATVNGLCMFGLGTLLKWKWGPEWVVPLLLVIFSFAFSFGGGLVPYVLISEVFVPEVKGLAHSLSMTLICVANSILLFGFVPATEVLGLNTVFYIFGVFALSTALFAHKMLPETKGLNPYVIEKLFDTGNLE